MIVTASTLQTQPEKDIGCRVRHLIQNQIPLAPRIPIVVLVNPVSQKTRGHQGVRAFRKQLVTRQLFLHKSIIRLVLIQRINHIVSVAPCIRSKSVSAVSV